MRRRLTVVVAVLCLAALGASAVALANGGGKGAGEHRSRPATPHHRSSALSMHGVAAMVLTSLAGRLDVQPAELRKAVEAVVAQQRKRHRGRDLALGCFDDPATCDLAALRKEIHFRHHGRKPGMMPGGRSSSAPLR